MSSKTAKVLIMEDAHPAQGILLTSLRTSRFALEEARNPDETLRAIRKGSFDLTLLDIEDLPAITAIELCRQIRALAQPIGILLITSSNRENEIVQALEAGADDYITKPFRVADLISRCQVVMHRNNASNAIQDSSFTVGEFHLDLDRRQLRKAGKVVHLTPTEFSLLRFLMKNHGTALTHTQLLRTIWGPEYGQELEYLRSYIRLLRKKIETIPSQPKYLLTEPCVGYRFCVPANSHKERSDAGLR